MARDNSFKRDGLMVTWALVSALRDRRRRCQKFRPRRDWTDDLREHTVDRLIVAAQTRPTLLVAVITPQLTVLSVF